MFINDFKVSEIYRLPLKKRMVRGFRAFFAFKSRFGPSAHSTTVYSEGGQGSYEGQTVRIHKIVRMQGLLRLRGQFLSTPGFT